MDVLDPSRGSRCASKHHASIWTTCTWKEREPWNQERKIAREKREPHSLFLSSSEFAYPRGTSRGKIQGMRVLLVLESYRLSFSCRNGVPTASPVDSSPTIDDGIRTRRGTRVEIFGIRSHLRGSFEGCGLVRRGGDLGASRTASSTCENGARMAVPIV